MKQRQCVVMQGDQAWCRDSALQLLAEFSHERVIWLSNQSIDGVSQIALNKAQTLLGKEFDAVVVDGLSGINPDALGAVIGTVIAGGTIIIMLSDDNDSLWQTRFNHICSHYHQLSADFQFVQQTDKLVPLIPPSKRIIDDHLSMTDDQKLALTAILKVVHGHRRRPLVLSADRGRGKSAILGIAAAELLTQGKQTILVTAPSFASAATVFEHASRALPDAQCSHGLISYHGALIKFIAPDVLVEEQNLADLLLVDEAAAIPATMLEQLLEKYSRIVFASTIHGYEGTGRGFTIRFQKTLDLKTPDWNRVHMTQPVRWRHDDMVESFSFESLLLDAAPVEDALITDAIPEECHFDKIDRDEIIKDEAALRSLFGLMVLAHYRTRPSDLMMMLDRDDISIYVMRFNGHIVASAWCVSEGGLDNELSEAIYAGERRLKGHLLPQSLLAHAGLSDAGALSYQRIIRLAVHPYIQGRGVGHKFVQAIIDHIRQTDVDLIGVSFASSIELIRFWSQNHFQALRLGLHHDEVSGSHAVLMFFGLSSKGQQLVEQGLNRFSQHWPLLLHQQFQHVQAELIIAISQLLPSENVDISKMEQHELAAFSLKQRGYEASQVSLWQAMSIWLRQDKFQTLTVQQQHLCVMLVLQQRPIKELCRVLGYNGKSDLLIALRQVVASLML